MIRVGITAIVQRTTAASTLPVALYFHTCQHDSSHRPPYIGHDWGACRACIMPSLQHSKHKGLHVWTLTTRIRSLQVMTRVSHFDTVYELNSEQTARVTRCNKCNWPAVMTSG